MVGWLAIYPTVPNSGLTSLVTATDVVASPTLIQRHASANQPPPARRWNKGILRQEKFTHNAHGPGPISLGAAVGSGTSDGYYEEAREGQIVTEGSRRQPISVRDAHRCWTGAVRTSENTTYANFVELRQGEVPRIPLPRTRVSSIERKGEGGSRIAS